jgi:anthranilate synthase component 1
MSGAPKIRAIELVYDLEKEKRGVYAGVVGWSGYDLFRMEQSSGDLVAEWPVDTCIAIHTMLVKGVASLQAGGDIVFDSDETDE